MNVKFFFLNILKTTHNSVRESVKNALSRTLLHLVFKIFKKENFTIIKSVFFKRFEIFHQQMHTPLKNKEVILDRKILKMQSYSSFTLHVSSENPISAEKLKITLSKIQILPPNVVWSKTNWSYTFLKWILWKISSNWLFQRNVDSDLERAQTSEHCFRVT